jgi:AGCS family alanine or glycine:cation symporter
MAIALKTGGPGAIFWMWVMAILGSFIKFVSCSLGIIYLQKNSNGRVDGGPMYYIEHGLRTPKVGILFAVATIISAICVGNLSQVNSFALTVVNVNPWIVGVIFMSVVAFVFQGGVKRFSKLSTYLVPIKTIIYLIFCMIVLIKQSHVLMDALRLIVTSAFTPHAAVGGVGGFTLIQTVQSGFNRGLFATDAGAGLEAIIHSNATNKTDYNTAFTQGLIASAAPLIVVFLCTITALVLIVSNAWQDPSLKSSCMCLKAFQDHIPIPGLNIIFMGVVFSYALTSLTTWSFCYDKAIQYIFGKPKKTAKVLFLIMIPIGCTLSVEHVWMMGDIAFNFMLLINIVSVFLLFPKIKYHFQFWYKNKYSQKIDINI